MGNECSSNQRPSFLPDETFCVPKDEWEGWFSVYRTCRFILECWHRLHAEGLMPEAYDRYQSEPSHLGNRR